MKTKTNIAQFHAMAETGKGPLSTCEHLAAEMEFINDTQLTQLIKMAIPILQAERKDGKKISLEKALLLSAIIGRNIQNAMRRRKNEDRAH